MSDSSQYADQDDKKQLRARMLAARRALSPQVLAIGGARVRAVLAYAVARLHHSTARPVTVAAYAPVGAEPGGTGLPATLAHALPAGGRLLLPVLRADFALEWAEYDGTLTRGPYGLAEPTGPRAGPEVVADASLVVVPALAVDRWGARLGRGGGSYDRALRHAAGEVPVVALLHDGELLDTRVPERPHDRRVTAVVTPDEGWRGLALPAKEC